MDLSGWAMHCAGGVVCLLRAKSVQDGSGGGSNSHDDEGANRVISARIEERECI